jgi:hypothetical protein
MNELWLQARWLCDEALKQLPTSRILYEYSSLVEVSREAGDACDDVSADRVLQHG